MTVELHLGDCLEVMRGMPDKSVDVKPVKRENDYQNDNRTNTGG